MRSLWLSICQWLLTSVKCAGAAHDEFDCFFVNSCQVKVVVVVLPFCGVSQSDLTYTSLYLPYLSYFCPISSLLHLFSSLLLFNDKIHFRRCPCRTRGFLRSCQFFVASQNQLWLSHVTTRQAERISSHAASIIWATQSELAASRNSFRYLGQPRSHNSPRTVFLIFAVHSVLHTGKPRSKRVVFSVRNRDCSITAATLSNFLRVSAAFHVWGV